MAAIPYFGGVAGVAALLLSLVAGRTRRRLGLLVLLGIGLAAAWILLAYFSD